MTREPDRPDYCNRLTFSSRTLSVFACVYVGIMSFTSLSFGQQSSEVISPEESVSSTEAEGERSSFYLSNEEIHSKVISLDERLRIWQQGQRKQYSYELLEENDFADTLEALRRVDVKRRGFTTIFGVKVTEKSPEAAQADKWNLGPSIDRPVSGSIEDGGGMSIDR